jgi:hypothetical protein
LGSHYLFQRSCLMVAGLSGSCRMEGGMAAVQEFHLVKSDQGVLQIAPVM